MFNDGDIIIHSNDIRSYEWRGWDKMQYVHYNSNMPVVQFVDAGHDHITVHYYQRIIDGIVYKSGFKFK